MSDPVALVCVRSAHPPDGSASRWRRRASSAQGLRAAAALTPKPARTQRRFGGAHGALLGLLLAVASWAGLAALHARSGDSALSRRIGAGCEELEPCLSLEADAEQRLEACWLGCGRATAELSAVRQMRFRAEERRAVREHYRERERNERVERARELEERREQWQRERAARAEEAAREQRHRLELERLRQEHLDRRIAEERQRRVSYLALLGPEGRTLRLKRCLERSHERCDALTLELIDAARNDEERRALAEMNEGIVHAVPKPKAAPAASPDVLVEQTSSKASAPNAPPAFAPAELDDTIVLPSS